MQFGGRSQYLTGTNTLLIFHALCSVSKVTSSSSSASKSRASRWLMPGFKFGCDTNLFERRGKVESLNSVFILGDAGVSVVPMEFVDGPLILLLASACRGKASRRDTVYADENDDVAIVAVEAGCVVVEPKSAGVSSSESTVMA